MKIAFRTDASLQMGSGHVMRCLTLADALTATGAQCHFISRAHPGHLDTLMRQRGYASQTLPAPVDILETAISSEATANSPPHAQWLGCAWQTDAQQSSAFLRILRPDWLVVDHYALDHNWENAVAAYCHKLMVIDDLADRAHACELLLDPNLGRQPNDYSGLVPSRCQVLTGPGYALLRPEFAELRTYSLQRRQSQHTIGSILISMGGVDQDNATAKVLRALTNCALPADCRITVVMGLTAPWLDNVKEIVAKMPWATEVVVNVSDMAQRMADSDLAIGAAGSTSWERCCLGLPTLLLVLAENQREIADALVDAKAAIALRMQDYAAFETQLANAVANIVCNEAVLIGLSRAAAQICNGHGVRLVGAHLVGSNAS